jgi:hypothetical protein
MDQLGPRWAPFLDHALGWGNFVTDIHASLLPLAGGLALLQAHAWSVLGTFINKLDASAFKGASDLIQC